MILDNPTISGSLKISGSTTILGTLSASVIVGDGSGLIGVTSYTDSDTLDYINSIGVVSGSVNWDTLIGKPSGIVSSSTQLSTEISGAFTSTSASLASDIQNNDTRLSTLEGKTLVSSSNQISYTGITDIPNGIISSSAQLSNATIPGDLTVGGILTAQEFHTEFVSASIIYQSGSTQFGNSSDDVHTFIGTISATTIQNVISSSAQIDYDSIPNRVTNNNQLTNGAGYTTCVGDITGVTAGTGLTGGGTSGTVTVSHADTSTLTGAQGSAGISSITVDALGHVTAVTTATYCTTDTNTTYTANEMLTCIKTVDGAGSGLDADLLDGNQASAFYLATNPNGYTSCTGTLTGTGTSGYISKWNGSTSQTNSIIYDNGTNVGIGTTSPTSCLHIYGSHTTAKATIYSVGNGGSSDASLDMWASEPGQTYNGSGIGNNVNGYPYYGRRNTSLGQTYIRFVDDYIVFGTGTLANASTRMTLKADKLGIGTGSPAEKLHVVGNIVATGNITGYYSSDEKLKENKEVLKNPIEKINKISGYEFDWKEIPSYGVPKHDVGVIAQEIEEVLPEIVARREDGYLAVRYEKITPLLIEGIKELSKEVESLKDIIKNNGITK